MKVLGIDPGVSGGLAIIETVVKRHKAKGDRDHDGHDHHAHGARDHSDHDARDHVDHDHHDGHVDHDHHDDHVDVSMIVVDAIDIPVVGTKAKERVDVIAIQKWIGQHRPALACIERAQSMPKQGSSSGFKYGRATGAIEAAIVLSGIPTEIIEPSVWKRALCLPGKDKEAARQRALELFPAAHALLARKKDHGRAEACLIALFGLKNSRLVTALPGAQTGSINETNPTVGANFNE